MRKAKMGAGSSQTRRSQNPRQGESLDLDKDDKRQDIFKTTTNKLDPQDTHAGRPADCQLGVELVAPSLSTATNHGPLFS